MTSVAVFLDCWTNGKLMLSTTAEEVALFKELGLSLFQCAYGPPEKKSVITPVMESS